MSERQIRRDFDNVQAKLNQGTCITEGDEHPCLVTTRMIPTTVMEGPLTFNRAKTEMPAEIGYTRSIASTR